MSHTPTAITTEQWLADNTASKKPIATTLFRYEVEALRSKRKLKYLVRPVQCSEHLNTTTMESYQPILANPSLVRADRRWVYFEGSSKDNGGLVAVPPVCRSKTLNAHGYKSNLTHLLRVKYTDLTNVLYLQENVLLYAGCPVCPKCQHKNGMPKSHFGRGAIAASEDHWDLCDGPCGGKSAHEWFEAEWGTRFKSYCGEFGKFSWAWVINLY